MSEPQLRQKLVSLAARLGPIQAEMRVGFGGLFVGGMKDVSFTPVQARVHMMG